MAIAQPTPNSQKADWTILVYMAADNVLYRAAKRSLNQITNSSPVDRVSVIVQLQGPQTENITRFVRNQGEPKFRDYKVKAFPDDRKLQLEDFVVWSADNAPASKYMLVLWGHGDGLDKIYKYKSQKSQEVEAAFSDLFGVQGAVLPTEESDFTGDSPLRWIVEGVLHARDADKYIRDVQIGEVLKSFQEKTGEKLALMGFDACLMGMIEVCSEIKDSVRLCLASASVVPDHSWPYDKILEDIARNPGIDARVASAVIAARYVESYSTGADRRAVQLSSFDLGATEALEVAMRTLVESLIALPRTDTRAKTDIANARDLSAVSSLEKDYCDLYSFCLHLGEAFQRDNESCRKVSAAVDDVINVLLYRPLIVYHDHSNSRQMNYFRGLSIYFPRILPKQRVAPHSGKGEITAYNVIWSDYIQMQFCKRTRWPDFLEHYLGFEAKSAKSV